MVRGWEGWLKDAMHRVNGPSIDTLKGDCQIVIHEDSEYGTYADGYYLMASKVWKDIQNYESKVGFLNQISTKKLHKRIPNFN